MFLDINTWWAALTGVQKIFWGIACVFSVLFVIQFVLSLIGLDFEGDAEVDFDTDVDTDLGSGDIGFALFSARSIIAFFTFFGWTGVMVLNAGGSPLIAVVFSTLSGSLAMLIVAYMFFQFAKLTEVGNTDVRQAILKEAQVYIPIPAHKNGFGKVSIHLGGSLREMSAVTDGDALPTGMTVRVLDVLENNILLVEKADFILDL